MGLDRVIAIRNTKTIYKSGNKCVKVFSKAYSKAKVMSEALNHSIVEETDLNIPKLLQVDFSNEKYALVSEFIKGDSLSDLMKNEENIERYLDLFVDLQIKIHSYQGLLLENQYERYERRISKCSLDATTRYDLKEKLSQMDRELYLCHGDFNPTNIIITKEGIPYILDWSDASVGNKTADAARTYLWLAYKFDAAIADRYLDKYCEKSDTAKQYLKKWIPIVAAQQSTISYEEERKFLLSFVNVI